MQKTRLVIAFLQLLMCSWIAECADTDITITGNVRDNACSISADSEDLTVNLQSIASKQFNMTGSTSIAVPFNIILSPCGTSVTAIRIGFSGASDSQNNMLIANAVNASAASGIGIQILDSKYNPLKPNITLSDAPWIKLTTGSTNILHFYARMMATHRSVTAGQVAGTADFTVEFE